MGAFNFMGIGIITYEDYHYGVNRTRDLIRKRLHLGYQDTLIRHRHQIHWFLTRKLFINKLRLE